MLKDLTAVTRILEETAQEEILPRFRALADHEVQTKHGGELVTSADQAAEAVLSRRLSDLLPGSLVVAEEAVSAAPELISALDGEDPVWVVDPVDGTGNFAKGRPAFAVMVGLIVAGKSIAGWIHDPIKARTAVGESGAGAFMGGRRLTVAAPGPVAEMTGTLHASTFAPKAIGERVQARRGRVSALRSLSCAGLEYLKLLTAEMQFTLFTRLKPWDHAPGILLHEEAGGFARLFDGRPYGARRYREIGVLMAPDEASWHAWYATLLGD